MKKSLLLCVIGMLLSSCSPTVLLYYQVYKVQPTNEISKSDNSLVYEDSNCEVRYNFWREGGNVGFLFHNKSDQNIYVNMKESFFIYNGIAYDYYKNREFTSSTSISESSMYTQSVTSSYGVMGTRGVSATVSGYSYPGLVSAGVGANKTVGASVSATSAASASSGFGVNVKEQDIICIPPKSAKVISEYNVNELLYRDCNLFLFPSKKQIRTSSFSEDNSPYIFSNRISYIIENTNSPIKMEHKFYVSEISNYPEEDIIGYRTNKYCNDEQTTSSVQQSTAKKSVQQSTAKKSVRKHTQSSQPVQEDNTSYFKNYSPDKFYIKYSKDTNDTRRH